MRKEPTDVRWEVLLHLSEGKRALAWHGVARLNESMIHMSGQSTILLRYQP